MLTKDTKPRRGDVGNVFWGLVVEPILEVPPLFSVCVLTPALPLSFLKDKSPPASLRSYYCPPPHPCPEERGQIYLWSPSASIPHAISPVCIFIMQTIHTRENKLNERLCVAGQGEKSGNFFTDSFVPLKRIMHSFQAVPFTVQLLAFYHVIDWG